MSHYQQAIALIDQANTQDPERVTFDGKQWPGELLYSIRMTNCLDRFEPQATEALKLAARAQHIKRWEIPRDSYPLDRKGYHLWRTRLYDHHAQVAGEMLRQAGYDPTTIDRVGQLLRKERIKSDQEMQTLEDVICLVFLEYYFDEFAQAHNDEKLITILRRTWNKMSPRGQQAAMTLPLSARAVSLVQRALAASSPSAPSL